MESPAQIARLKAAALARIANWRREIAIAEREIQLYDELLRLHVGENRSNIDGNMQVATEGKSRATKISATKAKDTSSRRAAIAVDLPDGEIATLTGASRQAVQKWHAGKLAIPRRHADLLAALAPKNGKPRAIPTSVWQRIGN